MKNSLRPFLVAASVAAFACVSVSEGAVTLEERPGYVDIGSLTAPESGGQLVEINVQGLLLSLASKIVQHEEPAVAEIIRGLHSVRVNVVSLDDSNRESVVRQAATLRESLEAKGWSRVANVRDSGDHVAVFLKGGADDAIEGITITVMEKSGNAVFINVVGDIKPEQLVTLGERLGIDPLKHAGEAVKS